jgi:hypothetical protein
VETICDDQIDNDGDGLTDCQDPDCLHRFCMLGNASFVCCGTMCIDISSDPKNCGGCGTVCSSGSCVSTGVSGTTLVTGTCRCDGTNLCPNGQNCAQFQCVCGPSNQCGADESCNFVCFYPP